MFMSACGGHFISFDSLTLSAIMNGLYVKSWSIVRMLFSIMVNLANLWPFSGKTGSQKVNAQIGGNAISEVLVFKITPVPPYKSHASAARSRTKHFWVATPLIITYCFCNSCRLFKEARCSCSIKNRVLAVRRLYFCILLFSELYK